MQHRFPPLIAQVEFVRGDVARVVALIVAIAQGAYAFAPAAFGLVRDVAPLTVNAPDGAAPFVFAGRGSLPGSCDSGAPDRSAAIAQIAVEPVRFASGSKVEARAPAATRAFMFVGADQHRQFDGLAPVENDAQPGANTSSGTTMSRVMTSRVGERRTARGALKTAFPANSAEARRTPAAKARRRAPRPETCLTQHVLRAGEMAHADDDDLAPGRPSSAVFQRTAFEWLKPALGQRRAVEQQAIDV